MIFTAFINSIALPRNLQNELFVGMFSTIAGFGVYDENALTYSNEERWATLIIISNERCSTFERFILPSQLCTDSSAGKYAYIGLFNNLIRCLCLFVILKNIIKGDNGGGLFFGHPINPDGRYLVGVEIGGSKTTPGFYTRVTSYVGWIDMMISSYS